MELNNAAQGKDMRTHTYKDGFVKIIDPCIYRIVCTKQQMLEVWGRRNGLRNIWSYKKMCSFLFRVGLLHPEGRKEGSCSRFDIHFLLIFYLLFSALEKYTLFCFVFMSVFQLIGGNLLFPLSS